MKYITKNRKFFNLDVTGLNAVGKFNEYGIPFMEVIKIHDLCIRGISLPIIKVELQKILKSGRDINEYINPFGCNLMFFVNNVEVLKFLLDLGCDANHRSHGFDKSCVDNSTPGTTALHYAGQYFLINSIKVLGNIVEDKNLLDDDEVSAMGYAQMNYDEELMDRRKGRGRYSDKSIQLMGKVLIYMSKKGFVATNYLDK